MAEYLFCSLELETDDLKDRVAVAELGWGRLSNLNLYDAVILEVFRLLDNQPMTATEITKKVQDLREKNRLPIPLQTIASRCQLRLLALREKGFLLRGGARYKATDKTLRMHTSYQVAKKGKKGEDVTIHRLVLPTPSTEY